MATVRTNCPDCGVDADLSPASLLIDDEDDSYTFSCPTCERSVRKRLDPKIRALLRSADVRTFEEVVASEVVELIDDADIWRGVLSS